MRKIPARRTVLLLGMAFLFSCAPPHVIDDDPSVAPGSGESEPAEPARPEPDAPAPDEPGDEDPGSGASDT